MLVVELRAPSDNTHRVSKKITGWAVEDKLSETKGKGCFNLFVLTIS